MTASVDHASGTPSLQFELVVPIAARGVGPNVVAEEHLGAAKGVRLQREIGRGVIALQRQHGRPVLGNRHRAFGRRECYVALRNIGEVENVAKAKTGHRDRRGGLLIELERAHARERDADGSAVRVDDVGEIGEPAAADADVHRTRESGTGVDEKRAAVHVERAAVHRGVVDDLYRRTQADGFDRAFIVKDCRGVGGAFDDDRPGIFRFDCAPILVRETDVLERDGAVILRDDRAAVVFTAGAGVAAVAAIESDAAVLGCLDRAVGIVFYKNRALESDRAVVLGFDLGVIRNAADVERDRAEILRLDLGAELVGDGLAVERNRAAIARLDAGPALIVDRAIGNIDERVRPDRLDNGAVEIGHVTNDRDAAATEGLDQELIGETVAVPV